MSARVRRADREASGSWAGIALLQQQSLLYCGPIAATDWHAHDAIQLILSPESEPARVLTRAGEIAGPAVAIGSRVEHAIGAAVNQAGLIFVDANTAIGRQLSAATADRVSLVDSVVTELPELASSAEAQAFVDRVLERLACGSPREPRVLHPCVVETLARLPSMVRFGPVTLAGVAADVGLSPSRLAHLFRDQVGTSWRAHVRWVRLSVAMRSVASGSGLTEAAHAAGFSDAGHFSRTFRTMFGMSPSTLTSKVRWLHE